jgi:hypothetical protein
VPQLPTGVAVAQTPPSAILRNPNIVLTELARQDIEAGVIDGRVLQVLKLLSQRFSVSVSVLKSGHSPLRVGHHQQCTRHATHRKRPCF